MKNKWILIIALMSLFMLTSGRINAEERPIYVGDIIELNIDSSTYSMDDIKLAFEDFEIVDLREEAGMYKLKFRSFEVGQHKVMLGNTEVVITIVSLLNEESSKLVEANTDLAKAGLVIPWTLIKFIFLSITMVGLVILVVLLIKSVPRKPLSTYDYFINQLKSIHGESDDYAYRLTSEFKRYIEKQFQQTFKGLTTPELITSLGEINEAKDSMESIGLWLNKCDTFKYSKDKGNTEAKALLKQELLTIVNRIEASSEVTKA